MRWVLSFALTAVLTFAAPVFAIGPVPIDEITPENKAFWDNTVVVTAVVKEILKQEKTWRVASLAPISVISGDLDPGKQAIIRIGYPEAGTLAIPQLKEGDRVIAICRRRNPGESPEFDWAKACDPGEFELRIGYVDAGDICICGYCVLSRPGENLDLEKAESRVQSLVETIRKIRSQKPR